MLIEYVAHDNCRQQNLRESLSNIDHRPLLFKWKYHLVAASWGKDEPAEVSDSEASWVRHCDCECVLAHAKSCSFEDVGLQRLSVVVSVHGSRHDSSDIMHYMVEANMLEPHCDCGKYQRCRSKRCRLQPIAKQDRINSK